MTDSLETRTCLPPIANPPEKSRIVKSLGGLTPASDGVIMTYDSVRDAYIWRYNPLG